MEGKNQPRWVKMKLGDLIEIIRHCPERVKAFRIIESGRIYKVNFCDECKKEAELLEEGYRN